MEVQGSGQKLTTQETKVAELVALGATNKQAAEKLGITEKTVKFHLTNVYKKLGVNRHMLILKYGSSLASGILPMVSSVESVETNTATPTAQG